MVVREGSATPHAICARESGAGRATDPTAPCAPPPPPTPVIYGIRHLPHPVIGFSHASWLAGPD